jgi:hypothetical protein
MPRLAWGAVPGHHSRGWSVDLNRRSQPTHAGLQGPYTEARLCPFCGVPSGSWGYLSLGSDCTLKYSRVRPTTPSCSIERCFTRCIDQLVMTRPAPRVHSWQVPACLPQPWRVGALAHRFQRNGNARCINSSAGGGVCGAKCLGSSCNPPDCP